MEGRVRLQELVREYSTRQGNATMGPSGRHTVAKKRMMFFEDESK